MEDRAEGRRAAIWGQLIALCVGGAVILPLMGGAVLVAAVGGGGGVAPMLGLLFLALTVVGLWLVAKVTAAATPLGRTAGGRIGWAVLVAGLGSGLLLLAWIILDETRLHGGTGSVVPLAGVPFALVAGLLMHGRRPRLITLAILLVLAAGGAVALQRTGPDEVTARLEAAGRTRQSIYVVRIAGYGPGTSGETYGTSPLLDGHYLPTDPAAIPPYRYVDVIGYRRTTVEPGGYGVTAVGSYLAHAVCTAEPDGLTYRSGNDVHGYEVRRGGWTVVVSGNTAVDRDALRAGARTAHRADATELAALKRHGDVFVAALPGYRVQPVGEPPGMQYEPQGHNGGPESVQITVDASGGTETGFCQGATCTPADDGLTYLVRDDPQQPPPTHGYLLTRDGTTVRVIGGLGVDKDLLRRTVLQARPATDQELVRGLPAPRDRTVVQRFRGWLKARF
ncbi:hypothetical protein ACWKSP_21755 [Micromonosporaceae bacterium Da 78-11]